MVTVTTESPLYREDEGAAEHGWAGQLGLKATLVSASSQQRKGIMFSENTTNLSVLWATPSGKWIGPN